MNIDCGHLKAFDAELYRQLVSYPQEVIPTFDMAANELFFEKYPGSQLEHQIQVCDTGFLCEKIVLVLGAVQWTPTILQYWYLFL